MRMYRYVVNRKMDRKASERLAQYPAVSDADTVADVVRRIVGRQAKEHFFVFYLDTANRIMGYELVAIGSQNQVYVQPADALRGAVACGALAIIVAHNHPSGLTEPSDADVTLTETLRDGARLLGIKLLDHVIVTDTNLYSFQGHGRIW